MLTILFNRLNRIQMKVSLSQTLTDTQTVFPLYIFLARLVSDVGAAEVVIVPFKQNCFCALLPAGFIGCNTSTLIFFFICCTIVNMNYSKTKSILLYIASVAFACFANALELMGVLKSKQTLHSLKLAS